MGRRRSPSCDETGRRLFHSPQNLWADSPSRGCDSYRRNTRRGRARACRLRRVTCPKKLTGNREKIECCLGQDRNIHSFWLRHSVALRFAHGGKPLITTSRSSKNTAFPIR